MFRECLPDAGCTPYLIPPALAHAAGMLLVGAIILTIALAVDHWIEEKKRAKWRKSVTRNKRDGK